MARENNYLIQAAQAKARFLTYDQEKLIQKLHLPSDESWLYTTMLTTPYRIHRGYFPAGGNGLDRSGV